MVSRETIPMRWISDRGLHIAAGAQTLRLYRKLAEARIPGVVEVVPADGTLLVILAPGMTMPARLTELISASMDLTEAGQDPAGRQHHIPVRFHGEDLVAVARQTGYAPDALVDRLCSLSLQVKFLGFQPGFAYLDGLPPELRLPRRPEPRTTVPAGSVALGGGYCGIYPFAGPGGWHLLGATDARLFDPSAAPPALFQPGDTVMLVAA
jgi:KipI family sensor histidine kinase inhibitor